MNTKPLAPIAILFAVLAAIEVAGCASQNTNVIEELQKAGCVVDFSPLSRKSDERVVTLVLLGVSDSRAEGYGRTPQEALGNSINNAKGQGWLTETDGHLFAAIPQTTLSSAPIAMTEIQTVAPSYQGRTDEAYINWLRAVGLNRGDDGKIYDRFGRVVDPDEYVRPQTRNDPKPIKEGPDC